MLLDLDPLVMVSGTAATAPRQPTLPGSGHHERRRAGADGRTEAPPTPAAAPAAAAADDDDGEPWIDSARCST